MATTVGLIKGATEAILGIGEVGDNNQDTKWEVLTSLFQVSVDNFTFKLFYKWSVSLFIAGSVVVVSSQFFGDPISCETVNIHI